MNLHNTSGNVEKIVGMTNEKFSNRAERRRPVKVSTNHKREGQESTSWGNAAFLIFAAGRAFSERTDTGSYLQGPLNHHNSRKISTLEIRVMTRQGV